MDGPLPLLLGGRALPWVKRAEHLGHTLHEDGTMSHDAKEKRAQFIDSSMKIMETFEFAYAEQKITEVEKYCSSLYGSNMWDRSGREAERVFASWRTSCKLAWDVPRGTRSYFIHEVLAPGLTSLRNNLLLRFRTF